MRTLEGSRSVSASRNRDGADIFCRRSVARARDECSAFYRPTSGRSCQATGAWTRGATGTLVPAAGGSTVITGEEIDPFRANIQPYSRYSTKIVCQGDRVVAPIVAKCKSI